MRRFLPIFVCFSFVMTLFAGDLALAKNVGGDSPWLVRVRIIDIEPDVDSTTSIGGSADVSNSVVPELDISYFFTPNIAAELILATAPHEVTAANTALGNLDLGDTWILPPTLTLQYHFLPGDDTWRPYVGAGVNYSIFYAEDAEDVADLEIDGGFGYALQAGVDIPLQDKWALNFDVKKIYLDIDGKLNGGAVTADIDLDPWIFGVGLTYDF